MTEQFPPVTAQLFTPDLWIFVHLIQIAVLLLLIRYLDVYEREPYSVILLMFVWGALGAGLLAPPLNGLVTNALPPDVEAVFGSALSAPIMEEFAKGLALVAAFMLSGWVAKRSGGDRFGGVTDGVVYGAAVGLGFAFTENIFYFFVYVVDGDIARGLEVFQSRIDLTGLNVLGHALYSAAFGAGLGLAVWSRTWVAKVAWSLIGFLAAVFGHASWNGLSTLVVVQEFGFATVAQWITVGVDAGVAADMEAAFERGENIKTIVFYLFLLGMVTAFIFWLRYERRIIRFELSEEVNHGVVTKHESEFVPSLRPRLGWYVRMLVHGETDRLRLVRTLHDKMVRLAMTKWRLRLFGGDSGRLTALRAEIGLLRDYASRLERLGTGVATGGG